VFVTFEGGEGAGKTTAIRALRARFESEGHQVTITREPGSGDVGTKIREILLHGGALDPKCELFLFLADRAQHVASIVRPALQMGHLVLCDRHADSTVVYQGVGRGLLPETTRPLNALATGGLTPDLTILFDLRPEIGLARLSERDRLDAEPLEFHLKVRQGFLEEAAREPERWVVIDAEQDPDAVIAACYESISSRLT